MKRRFFFSKLASGILAAVAAPAIFTPKLIKPSWRALPKPVDLLKNPIAQKANWVITFIDKPIIVGEGVILEEVDSIYVKHFRSIGRIEHEGQSVMRVEMIVNDNPIN